MTVTGYTATDNEPSLPGDGDAPDGRCPKCRTALEQGYGLMGGGMGVYHFCPVVQDDGQFHWMEKWEDPG